MSDVDILQDIKIDEKISTVINEPGKFAVIMLNDNTTPMEWVIEVLMKIFNHSQDTSEKIMLQIHTEGSSVVGIYNYEIAEQKAIEATNASRDRGFPLQLKLEMNE